MSPVPVQFDAEVADLLQSAGLPASDIPEVRDLGLFGVRADRRLVGVVGVEQHGDTGLLRSLVVAGACRRSGYGQALVAQAESWARGRGIQTLYLLTTTASGFFQRMGYTVVPRSEAPPAIAGTAQFAGLCPSTSAFMRKALATDC